MLGFQLARAGIDVTVLEKWPDFFRDFRGDTIHPSTTEILFELGILKKFLALPHDKLHQITAEVGSEKITFADFSHLKVHCPFIAFIPQWDFLNFIAHEAAQYPNFHLMMKTEGTDLIQENGKTIGVHARDDQTHYDIMADLVVGADGRHSMVREKSELPLKTLSAPMDVLWFRLSRCAADPSSSLGRIDLGRMMVMLQRGDYWQCGFLIRKGDYQTMHLAGIEKLRQDILDIVPSLKDRIHEIASWDQVKFLSVTVDRLQKWYQSGLICIGDAAHAMSPIGGVGINLAIQDSVAAANILIPAFLNHSLNKNDLNAIQKRREFPTKMIQGMQVFIQDRVIDRVLGGQRHPTLPFPLKCLQWFPILRRIPAYLIGMGVRREHVEAISNTDV